MAQGEPVGATTLGELTIGALERLFNALPRCPRACVVVTNLKDDVYLDGSGQLRTLIENLTKHYDRNAQAITPVQQNTGEVFAIVRKRLFDGLPSAERIDEVAQAYVAALQKAKRVDTIPTTPETFIERIRETYPFHPSIRDIVARFSENRGYQKTRALIRLLRLAVRGALAANDNAFLIGLQHLDFNDQATMEEIRKINPAYANAISRDVADSGQRARREDRRSRRESDRISGRKVLLMSSLSAAETPLRGLTDGELIEALVDPLLEVSEIKARARPAARPGVVFVPGRRPARLLRADGECHGRDHRDRAEHRRRAGRSDVARKVAGGVQAAHRHALFRPHGHPARARRNPARRRSPDAHHFERPADKLPQDFVDWWNRQDLQNRVLVLTADPNAVTTLRTSARRMRAIEKVEERIKAQHGPESPQMAELQGVKGREAAGFTSALRETFKTIVFPTGKGAAQGGRLPHGVRPKRLFGRATDRRHADQARQVRPDRQVRRTVRQYPTRRRGDSVRRRRGAAILAAAQRRRSPGLVLVAAGRTRSACQDIAVQRGYWREKEGLIAKKWERRTRVIARQDDFAQDPMVTGRFQINVTPEDADTVYVSESGPPDPTTAQKLDGRVYETAAAAVWFLAVDSKGVANTGDACEWRAPIRVKPDVKRVSGGYKVTFTAIPRSAVIHATFDDTDPKIGPVVGGRDRCAKGGDATASGRGGRWAIQPGGERAASGGPEVLAAGQPPKQARSSPTRPRDSTSRFEPKDTAAAFSALDRLAKTPNVHILGGSVEVNGGRSEADFLTLRLGRDVPVPAGDLDALVKSLVEKLKRRTPDGEIAARRHCISVRTGPH